MITNFSQLFTGDIDNISVKIFRDRLMQASICISMIALPVSAVIVPSQPKGWKLFELGLGTIFGAASTCVAKMREESEKRYENFLKLNLEHDKGIMTRDFAVQAALTDVDGELKIAAHLMSLPIAAQARYAKKLSLEGLLVTSIPKEKREDVKIDLPESRILKDQISAIEEENLIYNLTWLTTEFVYGSKIVVGGRGSGKSTYLKYEAARFLIENPNCELIICDPHFDQHALAEDLWLANIPLDILKENFVFKKAKEIYKKFEYVKRELNRRIDNDLVLKNNPELPVLKLILDEEENLKRNLNLIEFKTVLDVIEMIQDEGRKYGVEITIGMHSLKKENTGIDSASLQQMNWILFEKAAYDSTTKYPSDFDQKHIKEVAKNLSATVPKESGKIVVIIDQNSADPIITVLPLLKPPIINMVSNDEGVNLAVDATEEDEPQLTDEPGTTEEDKSSKFKEQFFAMVQWFKDCKSKYGVYPTAEQIKEAWRSLTGHELTEEYLVWLMERLFTEAEKD